MKTLLVFLVGPALGFLSGVALKKHALGPLLSTLPIVVHMSLLLYLFRGVDIDGVEFVLNVFSSCGVYWKLSMGPLKLEAMVVVGFVGVYIHLTALRAGRHLALASFFLGVCSFALLSKFEGVGVGGELKELVILTQKVRITLLFTLPLVASVACFFLVGFRSQIGLAVSISLGFACFLLALSFALEQAAFFQEFPESGSKFGELKSLRFKIDLSRSAFLVGATLLVGLCSVRELINPSNPHFALESLAHAVLCLLMQVVCSENFAQTLVCWCALSFLAQLLSFFYSGETKLEAWWKMRSRSGCYPMFLFCIVIWQVYRSFDYGLILSLASLSPLSRLAAIWGGGAGYVLLDVMAVLAVLAAMGPFLEALLYRVFQGKQLQAYPLEVLLMGAAGCQLLQSWAVLLKHSSVLGPTYKLVVAFFFGL